MLQNSPSSAQPRSIQRSIAGESRVPADDRRPGLKPPQFRLRTLLVWLSALSIVFALMTVASPYAVFALILFVLSVIAHVAGNSLGTRLRACGDYHPPGEEMRPISERYRVPDAAEFAPTTRLSQRQGVGKLVLALTLLGIIAGSIGGARLVLFLYGPAAPVLSIGFGSLAFGILGGIWCFIGFGFLRVLLGALWQASRA